MADEAAPPAPPAAGPGPSSAAAAAGAGAAAETDAPPPAVLFKRPAARARGNLRRNREGAGDGDDDDDDGHAGVTAGLAAAKRARPSAGAAAPLAASTREAGGAAAAADLLPARYGGDRTRQSGRDDLATAQLETETEFDRDNRAIREAILAAGTTGTAPAGEYRGEKARTDYRAGFRRPDRTAGAEKGGGAHGPLRAPTAARTTVLVDYAPDICKDYKETGYCGYGDACKFMHDRGDYKAGWQIDADWEAAKKKEAAAEAARADAWADEEEEGEGDGGGGGGEKRKKGAAAEDTDGLPFACLACRQPWHARSRPVATPCRHYFCEACALSAATSLCPACSKPTGGTFNAATAIEARLKKEAAAEGGVGGGGKAAAAAAGEEEEDEDKGGWS